MITFTATGGIFPFPFFYLYTSVNLIYSLQPIYYFILSIYLVWLENLYHLVPHLCWIIFFFFDK
jgi:hypothetical protein